ncbi:hypothetical protein CWE22_07530 [Pseudidiomarina aestuarii]|uniref:Tetratricopeptide repeat protein n=1 Tax=Pseudidiomarina aestuarii TaxID=624146 RepID=A0A7Z6ZV61_9GAMM|nr:hypothetical protein [Pseudidiomarina aestuarii]RUO41983.1 hypothetical protein CWE22_07530 [Pseudidiomarina aestuarii]
MRFAIPLCWLGLLYVSMSQSAAASSYKEAGEALLEGETNTAKSLIQNPGCAASPKCNELAVLFHIYTDDSDTGIERLSAYEVKYADEARTHAFAAEAWRSIAHQVNIFRKRTYYNKALQAKFRAGAADSALPRYKVLRASAFGQEGDIAAQRKLTADIVVNDDKWGRIAQLNLAQNTDDFEWGASVAAEAIASYPDDFFINERVAQFYWTLGNIDKAQQHFLVACKSAPEVDWFDRKKWLDSCFLVAQFADQDGMNREAAVAALRFVLAEHQLLTSDNLEYAKLLLKIAGENERAPANAFLERVIRQSDDETLVDAAIKTLKTYDLSH